jgi:hypothetical protein
MTGRDIEITLLRGASIAGVHIEIHNVTDCGLLIDPVFSTEWDDSKVSPFALIRHFASDEIDGCAGSAQVIGEFEYVEELLEAVLIAIIQARLEDVSGDDLTR